MQCPKLNYITTAKLSYTDHELLHESMVRWHEIFKFNLVEWQVTGFIVCVCAVGGEMDDEHNLS